MISRSFSRQSSTESNIGVTKPITAIGTGHIRKTLRHARPTRPTTSLFSRLRTGPMTIVRRGSSGAVSENGVEVVGNSISPSKTSSGHSWSDNVSRMLL